MLYRFRRGAGGEASCVSPMCANDGDKWGLEMRSAECDSDYAGQALHRDRRYAIEQTQSLRREPRPKGTRDWARTHTEEKQPFASVFPSVCSV